LSKQIITHIADVIGEFLDAGVFPGFGERDSTGPGPEAGTEEAEEMANKRISANGFI